MGNRQTSDTTSPGLAATAAGTPQQYARLARGELFAGRYLIQDIVAIGGMGEVYRALDTELDTVVAVKLVRANLLGDAELEERFKRELLLARQISHPNVVRIHDFGKQGKDRFISMQYVPGCSLKDRLSQGPFTLQEALPLFQQIAAGLQAVHDKGIVHRDLKPDNILLGDDGTVQVGDFGIAVQRGDTEKHPLLHLPGTPCYAAPEQFTGGKTGPETDVYAFGVIMYETLTGKRPFYGHNLVELMKRHCDEQAKSPSRLNPHIPAYLDRVILRCLAKSPKHRFHSVRDVAWSLQPKARVLAAFRRFSALAALWLLLFFMIGDTMRPVPGPLPQAPARRGYLSVAVMPFSNRGADHSLNQWEVLVPELIAADLSQDNRLNIVNEHRLLRETGDGQRMATEMDINNLSLKKAREQGIQLIIRGTIDTRGQALSIQAELLDAETGDLLARLTESVAERQGLFAAVDRLTDSLERVLVPANGSGRRTDRSVSAITTSSLEAFEYYVQGTTLAQMMRYQESAESLSRAVVLDPDFAMAYKQLAKVRERQGRPVERDRCLRKAWSLRHRVSDKEAALIKALYALVEQRDMPRAIGLYRRALREYPQDCDILLALSDIYRGLEEWPAVAELCQKGIRSNKRCLPAYENLCLAYLGMGQYARVRELLELYHHVLQGTPLYYRYKIRSYVCEKRFDLANETAKRMWLDTDRALYHDLTYAHILQLEDKPGAAAAGFRTILSKMHASHTDYHLGCILLASSALLQQGDIAGAREHLLFWAQKKESLRCACLPDIKLALAMVCSMSGNNTSAWKYTEQALEDARDMRLKVVEIAALQCRGLMYLAQGDSAMARQTAMALKETAESYGGGRLLRHWHHLEGRICAYEGDLEKAILRCRQAVDLLSSEYAWYNEHARFYYSLAQAYQAAGKLDQAVHWYERVTGLTMGRLIWGHIYTNAWRMLGRIYEAKGWHGKARDCFDKVRSFSRGPH